MSRTYDKDPYVILGISPTATANQVKQAYRRLAREYHPDLNKDSRAIERMKDINWANDILSDAQERSLYDRWRNSSAHVGYDPGANPSPFNATPHRSSRPSSNPPSSAGSQTRSSPPSNPPPQTTYSNERVAQNPQGQGCSMTMIVWIIIMVLVNVPRMIKPAQPIFSYSMENIATQTAYMEGLSSTMETFRMSQGIPTRSGTATPSPFYKTLFAPSPTVTVLRDEFGHEDLRPRIVPSSQEWEWINTYFPDLTTPEGLSDEVTFVFWDQAQRAIIIKTRQSGVFIISTYGGNITAGHYDPVVPTPTATVLMDEFGHADLRPSIVPGSWEWGQIHYYFPDLTTPDGLSNEVTLVIYDQLRGYQIKTRNSGDYWLFINVYDNSIAPAHFPPTATITPIP